MQEFLTSHPQWNDLAQQVVGRRPGKVKEFEANEKKRPRWRKRGKKILRKSQICHLGDRIYTRKLTRIRPEHVSNLAPQLRQMYEWQGQLSDCESIQSLLGLTIEENSSGLELAAYFPYYPLPLADFLDEVVPNHMSDNLLEKLTLEVVTGIAALHDQGGVHGDLKVTNLLIETKNTNDQLELVEPGAVIKSLSSIPSNQLVEHVSLKIADFDILNKTKFSAAPENFSKHFTRDELTDMFGLGIVLHDLIFLCDFQDRIADYKGREVENTEWPDVSEEFLSVLIAGYTPFGLELAEDYKKKEFVRSTDPDEKRFWSRCIKLINASVVYHNDKRKHRLTKLLGVNRNFARATLEFLRQP